MPKLTELERRIAAVEQLVRSLESGSDPATRAAAQELVGTLMELHAAALTRVLDVIRRHGQAGAAIVEQLARDETISGVLLLHDLHPSDLRTRVQGALEKTRPYLQSHGGNVELVAIDEPGLVRLRLEGSCHGCPSSAMTLKLAIEQAIQEAAPDVAGIVVEGEQNGAAGSHGADFVTLESTRRSTPASHEVVWEDLPPLADLDGTPRTREVDGREVLFCRVAGEIYAYGARCPACQADLSRGKLRGQVLVCAGCRQGYDVIHAGRATDRPDRHLDPYPIVTRDGRPQLALPALRVAAIAE